MKRQGRLILTLYGYAELVTNLKLLDGDCKQHILSGSYDASCRLWSLSYQRCLKSYHGHSHYVTSILTLSSTIFISASEELIGWKVYSGKSFRIDSSAFIPTVIKLDGDKLLTTCNDGALNVWNY